MGATAPSRRDNLAHFSGSDFFWDGESSVGDLYPCLGHGKYETTGVFSHMSDLDTRNVFYLRQGFKSFDCVQFHCC